MPYKRRTYGILSIAMRHPRMFAKMMQWEFINFSQLNEESFA